MHRWTNRAWIWCINHWKEIICIHWIAMIIYAFVYFMWLHKLSFTLVATLYHTIWHISMLINDINVYIGCNKHYIEFTRALYFRANIRNHIYNECDLCTIETNYKSIVNEWKCMSSTEKKMSKRKKSAIIWQNIAWVKVCVHIYRAT